MNVIKEKWNMICIALYAVTIVCLLLPAYSAFGFGVSAFTVLLRPALAPSCCFWCQWAAWCFPSSPRKRKTI